MSVEPDLHREVQAPPVTVDQIGKGGRGLAWGDPCLSERFQRHYPGGDGGRERFTEEGPQGNVFPRLDVTGTPVVDQNHAEDVVGEVRRGDGMAQPGRGSHHETDLGLDIQSP